MEKRKQTNIYLIIFFVFLIFITLGIFFYRKTKSKETKELEHFDDAKDNEKKNLQNLLLEHQSRIAELEKNIESIKQKEKFIFKIVRIAIGLVILLFNSIYLYIKLHFWNIFELTDFLNFNQLILFIYSFAALLLYGTPSRLINALKEKVLNYFKLNDFDSIEELKLLKAQSIEIEQKLNKM